MPRKTTRTSKSPAQVGFIHGFRSGLEEQIAKQLRDAGIDPQFEAIKVSYVQPAVRRTYTPDFPVSPTIIIETKGRFLPEDRKKHLWIKEQHPELDIRFVFTRASSPIAKGSKTTYAAWCEKHGFKWAERRVPDEWLREIRRTSPKNNS